MPQIYRRHSHTPPARPAFEFVGGNGNPNPRPFRRASGVPAQPPVQLFPSAITDADDSIVLSDLIRTGETSRLRRRGAMRLDHSARPLSSALLEQQRLIPIPISRSASPIPSYANPAGPDDDSAYGGQEWREWASDPDGSAVYGGAGPQGPGGGMQLEDFRHDADQNEQAYMLFCGGEVPPWRSHASSALPSFQPSALPGSSPSSHAHQPPSCSGDIPPTNGCGALLHLRAFPQKPKPVWVGKEEATDVVVSLDAGYFESTVIAKMMRSACGCIREGVGCAVWYVPHVTYVMTSTYTYMQW